MYLSQRYPDPNIRVLDDSFKKLFLAQAKIERLAEGGRWAEGPVWFGDQRCLIWSDVPANRMYRWDEQTGLASVFRDPSGNANGNTRDLQGRLLTCEHLQRRVTRTEYDGSITVLAERFEGKRLNSPNDIVVSSDGSVWFTDPAFGIAGYYEGEKAEPELPACIYRLSPEGELSVAEDSVLAPNGLAFSPDERILYVVQSRSTPRKILAFDVDAQWRLSGKRDFIDAGEGSPDGLRVDIEGNLWCGWGMGTAELDGVRVFNPDARAIGHISLPERCANLAFGGRHRNRLFMAASTGLYSLFVNTQGVR